jgi:hypothetical protein
MFDDEIPDMTAGEAPEPSAEVVPSDAATPAVGEEPEPASADPDEGGARNETEASLEAAQKDADTNFPATPVQDASATCGAPAPPPPTKDPSTEKTWIEYKLVDEDGISVPGAQYRVKTPDGSMIDGAFDRKGKARIPTIDPGNCKIWLLDVDSKEWRKG